MIHYTDIKEITLLTREEILATGKNGDDEYWDIPGGFFWGDPGYEQIVIGAEEKDGGEFFAGLMYGLYPNGQISYYELFKDGLPEGVSAKFYPNGNLKEYYVFTAYKGIHGAEGYRYYFYENGYIHKRELYIYGHWLRTEEWDETGKLVRDDKQTNTSVLESIAIENRKRRKRKMEGNDN